MMRPSFCSIFVGIGLMISFAIVVVLQESAATHRSRTIAFVLLLISISGSMLLLIANDAIRERALRRKLLKQMKATEKAEMKSLSKTLSFATASHNIRNMLTPIFGFIEKCVVDFPPTVARATNLKSIHDSTKDISGYLSHILDASKLEEGKMELEEQEFNVVSVLEEMVDLCRPLAMGKDVVLLFDLSDFSILEFSHVTGDKGKLKQVLWKLVNNAVKYTDEGQIVVRARVQKPDSESVIVPSRWDGFSKWLPKFFSNGEKIPSAVQQNRMEFVFEVDDSGEGIPKDKQKSIFGSGLGIVQSLVRLMGGKIVIVDKEEGQKGTCFRFSALLTVSDTNHNNKIDIELGNKITGVGKRSFYFELPIRTSVPDPPDFAPTSHVVLLIDDKAQRRALRKLMESLGITVIIVEEWQQLQYVLMNIKPKLDPFSSSGRSDSSSMDGIDENQTSSRMWSRFVLIVIDASAGPFQELHKAVTNFKTGLQFSSIKVVWLDKPFSRRFEDGMVDPSDDVMLKPFHGAGLNEVIQLIPDFQRTTTPVEEWASSSSSIHLNVRDNEIQEEEEDWMRPHKPLNGLTFLVVVNHKYIRDISTFVLSILGAKFEECEDGLQALAQFRACMEDQARNGVSPHVPPYDFIIMDCQMPRMDGYAATMAIREEERLYGIHNHIIGLCTSEEEVERAIAAGMDRHLTKPFQIQDILEATGRIGNRLRIA
ncbi:Histidine kinase CKI1 [Linum perenne]